MEGVLENDLKDDPAGVLKDDPAGVLENDPAGAGEKVTVDDPVSAASVVDGLASGSESGSEYGFASDLTGGRGGQLRRTQLLEKAAEVSPELHEELQHFQQTGLEALSVLESLLGALRAQGSVRLQYRQGDLVFHVVVLVAEIGSEELLNERSQQVNDHGVLTVSLYVLLSEYFQTVTGANMLAKMQCQNVEPAPSRIDFLAPTVFPKVDPMFAVSHLN